MPWLEGALLRQCSVCDGNLTWRHDLSTEKVRVREIIASLTTNMNIWLWVFAPNGRLWPAFYQPNVANIGMISNILREKHRHCYWWMMTLCTKNNRTIILLAFFVLVRHSTSLEQLLILELMSNKTPEHFLFLRSWSSWVPSRFNAHRRKSVILTVNYVSQCQAY